MWLHETGVWVKYDYDQNFWIEEQWQALPRPKTMKIDISGDVVGVSNNKRYCIDFDAMEQFNIKTKFRRTVKREPIAVVPQQQKQPSSTTAPARPAVDYTYIEQWLLPLTPVTPSTTSTPAIPVNVDTAAFVLHGFGQSPYTALQALKKAVQDRKEKAFIRLVS